MRDATTWTVLPEEVGRRLDAVLSDRLNLSRQAARRLLARDGVRMNGHTMRQRDKGRLLVVEDRIEVLPFEREAEARIIPQPNANVPIVATGEGWVVVNKPAGMPVHPLEPNETGTVLNKIVSDYAQVQGVGEGGLRSGVVHRLDVATSGVLAVATEQTMWTSLRQAFHEHQVVKRYHAVVAGRLEGQACETMNLVVARHRPAFVRVTPDQAASRRCTLTWRALRSTDHASLIEIDLGTGFLHQIRVMLAHLGHPVLGDSIYGDEHSAERLMLHASTLRWGPIHATTPRPTNDPGFGSRQTCLWCRSHGDGA